MKVTRLSINRFRNLTDIFCDPLAGVNVIFGENGQGKRICLRQSGFLRAPEASGVLLRPIIFHLMALERYFQ